MNPELQVELGELNAALTKAGADFQSHIIAQDDEYCLCNQDKDGNDVGKCTHPYSHQGMIRYMRMLTVHMRVAGE